MQGLGGDRHTNGKVLRRQRFGVVAAALVATPVEEDVLHAHTAHQLHGGIAVIGHQHVFGAHLAADGHADGFLAEGWRIGADPPGTLEGHRLLVEQAGQEHLPVEADQRIAVAGPGGQLAEGPTVAVEVAGERRVDPVVNHRKPPPHAG